MRRDSVVAFPESAAMFKAVEKAYGLCCSSWNSKRHTHRLDQRTQRIDIHGTLRELY